MADQKNKKKYKEWGFYAALGVCLLAIGGVAIGTYAGTRPTTKEGGGSTTAPSVTTTTATRAVEQPVHDVPDLRTTATAAPTTTTTTIAAPAAKPLFVLPVGNQVLRAYSKGEPVYSETMADWRTHDGTDFAAASGQDVKAVADGEIVSYDEDLLWGGTAVIDHGFGVKSIYRGVLLKGVAKGDRVSVGDVFATVTTIPCESADAPHLHLEVQSGGKTVDPVAAIGLEVRTTP